MAKLSYVYYGLIAVLVWSCQSYNPNTPVETALKPEEPEGIEDIEEYIASTISQMYPTIGKYRIKIVDKGYTLDFLIGGNQFKVRFDSKGNLYVAEIGEPGGGQRVTKFSLI